MSTRCRIGILNEDGSVDSIYCHFDGYLEGVGTELIESWTNEGSIRELIKLGNISSLGDCLSKCDAYIRDRGEDKEDNLARHDESISEYIRQGEENVWIEFLYLWMDGEWHVYSGHSQRFLPIKCIL